MDCKEFKNIVADLFDKVVDPLIKAECEKHISQCAECKEYYEEMLTTAEFLRPKHSPVIESEKVKVKSRRTATVSILYKVAALFAGVILLSGIAFAAIHIWSLTSNPSPKGEGNSYTQVSDTTRHSSPLPLEGSGEAAPVRYDEATLEQILTDMSDYYGLTLNWKNEEVKTLRLFYIWNTQQSAVEAIKSMNSFERIRLELSDSILTADIQTSSPKQ